MALQIPLPGSPETAAARILLCPGNGFLQYLHSPATKMTTWTATFLKWLQFLVSNSTIARAFSASAAHGQVASVRGTLKHQALVWPPRAPQPPAAGRGREQAIPQTSHIRMGSQGFSRGCPPLLLPLLLSMLTDFSFILTSRRYKDLGSISQWKCEGKCACWHCYAHLSLYFYEKNLLCWLTYRAPVSLPSRTQVLCIYRNSYGW